MKQAMLKLDNISVAFKDLKVLDEMSFTAYEGEIIGVVAPNGTGKTTMFNVMANFLRPNKGNVIFKDSHTYNSERNELLIHKMLTTFPDQSELFENLTGIDHLKLYANMWKGSTKHIQDIINQLNMSSYVKRRVRTYSLGMRQRLCFAMMAAADTPIMIMDEVMNGLDISNVAIISSMLLDMKKNNKLIFVASHLLENLDLYADRVIYLKGGEIIFEHQLKEKNDMYLKISIEPSQYRELNHQLSIPEGHFFIADHLLCIPLKNKSIEEQRKWMEQLLSINESELTIGPLGTMEYYEKYYSETSQK